METTVDYLKNVPYFSWRCERDLIESGITNLPETMQYGRSNTYRSIASDLETARIVINYYLTTYKEPVTVVIMNCIPIKQAMTKLVERFNDEISYGTNRELSKRSIK